MSRAIPILVAAVILTGCPHNALQPGAPVNVTRITPGASPVVTSGLPVAQRTAIFDAATFSAAWEQAFKGRDPMPPVPDVDFDHEFVILTALGERATGGYSIEVAKAYEEDGAVVASVLSVAPGKTCMVTMSPTQPVDVVKLPLPGSGRPAVRFAEQAATHDCGS